MFENDNESTQLYIILLHIYLSIEIIKSNYLYEDFLQLLQFIWSENQNRIVLHKNRFLISFVFIKTTVLVTNMN